MAGDSRSVSNSTILLSAPTADLNTNSHQVVARELQRPRDTRWRWQNVLKHTQRAWIFLAHPSSPGSHGIYVCVYVYIYIICILYILYMYILYNIYIERLYNIYIYIYSVLKSIPKRNHWSCRVLQSGQPAMFKRVKKGSRRLFGIGSVIRRAPWKTQRALKRLTWHVLFGHGIQKAWGWYRPVLQQYVSDLPDSRRSWLLPSPAVYRSGTRRV